MEAEALMQGLELEGERRVNGTDRPEDAMPAADVRARKASYKKQIQIAKEVEVLLRQHSPSHILEGEEFWEAYEHNGHQIDSAVRFKLQRMRESEVDRYIQFRNAAVCINSKNHFGVWNGRRVDFCQDFEATMEHAVDYTAIYEAQVLKEGRKIRSSQVKDLKEIQKYKESLATKLLFQDAQCMKKHILRVKASNEDREEVLSSLMFLGATLTIDELAAGAGLGAKASEALRGAKALGQDAVRLVQLGIYGLDMKLAVEGLLDIALEVKACGSLLPKLNAFGPPKEVGTGVSTALMSCPKDPYSGGEMIPPEYQACILAAAGKAIPSLLPIALPGLSRAIHAIRLPLAEKRALLTLEDELNNLAGVKKADHAIGSAHVRNLASSWSNKIQSTLFKNQIYKNLKARWKKYFGGTGEREVEEAVVKSAKSYPEQSEDDFVKSLTEAAEKCGIE